MQPMRAIKLPYTRCTSCGIAGDGCLTNDDGTERMPSPGDIAICVQCEHRMAFSDDLSLRDLTDEEHEFVDEHNDDIENNSRGVINFLKAKRNTTAGWRRVN